MRRTRRASVALPTKREKTAWTNFYSAASPKNIAAVPVPPAPKPRTRRAAPGESEAEILKAIMALLKHHPKVAKVWRVNSGVFPVGEHYFRANTQRGMSDICGVFKDGRSLFIECKTAKGRIGEHQQQFLDDMTRAGALAFVARSVNDVMEKLK